MEYLQKLLAPHIESFVAKKSSPQNPIVASKVVDVIAQVAGQSTPGRTDGLLKDTTFNAPGGIAVDGQDQVYVCDTGNHVIRKISSINESVPKDADNRYVDTRVSTYIGSGVKGYKDGPYATAKFNNPTDLCFDKTGGIIIVDYGNRRLRYAKNGTVTTIRINNVGRYDGTYIGVAYDQALDTLFVTDNTKHQVYTMKLQHSGTGAAAKVSTQQFPLIGLGARINTALKDPRGISVKNGKLFVSETSIHTIRVFDMNPKSKRKSVTIGTSGVAGHIDGRSTVAKFKFPMHIDVDDKGYIFVCDSGNASIRCIHPTSYVVTTVKNAVGQTPQVSWPYGIAKGWYSMYITDRKNNTLLEVYKKKVDDKASKAQPIRQAGNFKAVKPGVLVVKTVAGTMMYGSADTTPTQPASLGFVYDMVLDNQNNLLICDLYSNKIRKVTPAGSVTTFVGTGQPGGQDGAFNAATLNQPRCIVHDTKKRITYVAEKASIRKIMESANGHVVTTIPIPKERALQDVKALAINPAGSLYFIDGKAIKLISESGIVTDVPIQKEDANLFVDLKALAIDKENRIYFIDRNQVKTLTGDRVTLVAGQNKGGFADGPVMKAQFNNPQGIYVNDRDGYIWIADTGNNAIRFITSGGTVSTLLRSKQLGYRDGLANDALFNGPRKCIYDIVNRKFYVIDFNNYCVRSLSSTTASPLRKPSVGPLIRFDASDTKDVTKMRNLGTLGMPGQRDPNRRRQIFKFNRCVYKLDNHQLGYLHLDHRAKSHIQVLPSIYWNSLQEVNGGLSGVFVVQFPTVGSTNDVDRWARFIDFGQGAGAWNILFTRNGTQSQSARVQIINGNKKETVIDATVDRFIDNQFHVYAFTVQNTDQKKTLIKFFRDGVKIGEVSSPISMLPRATNKNYIGASNSLKDTTSTMNIREFGIYERVISEADMKAYSTKLRNKWRIPEPVFKLVTRARKAPPPPLKKQGLPKNAAAIKSTPAPLKTQAQSQGAKQSTIAKQQQTKVGTLPAPQACVPQTYYSSAIINSQVLAYDFSDCTSYSTSKDFSTRVFDKSGRAVDLQFKYKGKPYSPNWNPQSKSISIKSPSAHAASIKPVTLPISSAFSVELVFYFDGSDNRELFSYQSSARDGIQIGLSKNDMVYLLDNSNKTQLMTQALAKNKWYHIIFTVNNNPKAPTRLLYVNGAPNRAHNGSGKTPNFIATPIKSGTVYIGDQGMKTSYQGAISLIRMYNKILTEAEVKSAFNLARRRMQ